MDDRIGRMGDRVPELIRLFPLPGHVLLPSVPAPYRVFEPRYVTLVDDLLALKDDERWIAIPELVSGADAAQHAPAFHPVATAGTVSDVRPLDNGQYFIVVHGRLRVTLSEVESDHPYRLAHARVWPDSSEADPTRVRERLATIRQLALGLIRNVGPAAKPLGELVAVEDPDDLVWRLGSAVLPGPDSKRSLLRARSLERRLDIVEDALAGALALSVSGITGGGGHSS